MRMSIIRERRGFELNILKRMLRNVLKMFGYVERMEENRFFLKVFLANLEGNRGRGRLHRR